MINGSPPWYVVVRRDNGCPVLIYLTRQRAKLAVTSQGPDIYDVVEVVPKKDERICLDTGGNASAE